ncbi:hypothetical protein [Kitasatospora sp. NPDC004289]
MRSTTTTPRFPGHPAPAPTPAPALALADWRTIFGPWLGGTARR